MKILCHYFILLSVLSVSPLLLAEALVAETQIDGLWSDSNNPNCRHCYAVIAQDGEKVFFAHYIEWKGQPMVEYGQGTRSGDVIEYQVTVTRPIPGWATSGKHRLVLSKDGKSLVGEYSDNMGKKGPFSLVKIGK